MRLKTDGNVLVVEWESPIQHRDNEKQGKNYPTHIATFPRELWELWGVESFFIEEFVDDERPSEENVNRFLVTSLPQDDSWKISLYKRGKNSRVFNLPKKYIDLLEQYNFVKFCFDGQRCVMSLF